MTNTSITTLTLLLSILLIAVNIYIMTVDNSLLVQLLSIYGGWLLLVGFVSWLEVRYD